MTDTIAQIQALFDEIYQAWRDNDADAFVASYLDDATVTMPGTFHQGRLAVRVAMRAAFDGPLKGSRGVDEPQDIRIIDDRTAVVVSRAGVLMPGETEVPADRIKLATWVMCKRADSWKVAAYSNTQAAV